MKKVADLFSDWLVEREIVRKDDRELYAYGFWQGGVLLFNFLTVAVIGIVTGMFRQSVVFTIAYGLLRPVAGDVYGYGNTDSTGKYTATVSLPNANEFQGGHDYGNEH